MIADSEYYHHFLDKTAIYSIPYFTADSHNYKLTKLSLSLPS